MRSNYFEKVEAQDKIRFVATNVDTEYNTNVPRGTSPAWEPRLSKGCFWKIDNVKVNGNWRSTVKGDDFHGT